jgi:hypothetical protein
MEQRTYDAAELAQRRSAMQRFFHRTGWSFVLKPVARGRWGRDVTVNIAEKGTFRDIPVKGWTNTSTGTIFLREEIFDGIDFTDPKVYWAVEATIDALTSGRPINKQMIANATSVRTAHVDFEKYWRIAQTIVANYGVFGHEYCHAAYSDHAARDAFQMGMEDLRAEGLWMAQDPIRARQGLRACASFWVTHDTSPMAGEQAFDMSGINSHASLLHLYLLIVGRGRIGVLDDQSTLVSGIRELAEDVLGWDTVADADDIIDRFLETGEDVNDTTAADQRRALAKEFADLLPKEAGKPDPGIGCGCDPRSSAKDADEDQRVNESESGQGASSDDGDEAGQSGESGEESGDSGEAGEGEGDGESGEGQDTGNESGDGDGGDGGDSGDSGDGGGDGDGGKSGDEAGDQSDGEGAGDGGGGDEGESDEGESEGDGSGKGGDSGDSSDDDDDEADDEDGLTIGSNITNGGSTGSGENLPEVDPDFVTGTYGETIKPEDDYASDELETSDAFRLTDEQVQSLVEVLTEGLEEVSDSDGEAGWAISDEDGLIITSRSTSPTKVFAEVFSRQALTTRNRRLKAR